MSARWRKVAGDLRERPGRTLAIIAAIAVGCVMMTAALGARAILAREVDASFRGAHPPAATLTLDAVAPPLVTAARGRPGVVDAGARRMVRARAEVSPGVWRPLRIFAVDDFDSLTIATFRPERGAWPPTDGALLIERSALSVLETDVGDRLRVRAPGGAAQELAVTGVVHDPAQAPGWMDQLGYGYATTGTLAALGQGRHLDELVVTTTDGADRSARSQVADDLAAWLDAEGHAVRRVEVSQMRHPHADHMGTMLLVLQLFSAVSLALSGALAANVLGAAMARQGRQIGVLKAIGATSRQIAGLYLAGALVPALVAVVVGLPLGLLAARAFAAFAAGHLNITLASSAIPAADLGLAALLGVGVPLVAAAIPVVRAARRPARALLADAGALAPARVRTNRVRALPPSLRLSLRNAARRPIRAALTVGALALGGALLLTAGNAYESLQGALHGAIAARGEDVTARLLGPAPADALRRAALAVPGVRAAEAWGAARVALGERGAVGSSRYALLAPPAGGSALARARLVEGRWPRDDEAAVAVNRALKDTEPALEVGAAVTLLVERRPAVVTVVGVVEEIAEPAFYTGAAGFAAITGVDGAAGELRVVTADGEAAAVAAALEEALLAGGWFPIAVMTHDEYGQALGDHFLIVLICLSVIAAAAIVVGGLGLATSMGLAVLERTREIGVLRALGASRGVVLRVVLVEGLALAAASTALAVVLSIPLSLAVCRAVGGFGLHAEVPLELSQPALAAWAGLAGLVAVVACVGPARGALRPTVHEVLAYE